MREIDVAKPHILIVEDDPIAAQIIGHALHGYQLSYAYNGHQAIKLILDLSPDLITLDLQLPEVSGYQIAATLDQKDCIYQFL